MVSDRIRKLARVVDGPIEEDEVVKQDHVLFKKPQSTEVQRAITQWDKGKSEADTNEKWMDDIKSHPKYDELKGLSQMVVEGREVGK